MKNYRIRYNVGRSKYCVSFHNGVSKHRDGSALYDLRIFKNKFALGQFIAELKSEGYAEQ